MKQGDHYTAWSEDLAHPTWEGTEMPPPPGEPEHQPRHVRPPRTVWGLTLREWAFAALIIVVLASAAAYWELFR